MAFRWPVSEQRHAVEDRLDLRPAFYYVVVALDERGLITDRYQSISVDVERPTLPSAGARVDH